MTLFQIRSANSLKNEWRPYFVAAILALTVNAWRSSYQYQVSL